LMQIFGPAFQVWSAQKIMRTKMNLNFFTFNGEILRAAPETPKTPRRLCPTKKLATAGTGSGVRRRSKYFGNSFRGPNGTSSRRD
jgi:hypothetical protein